MKRYISVILSLALVTVVLPAHADAQTRVSAEGAHDHSSDAMTTSLVYSGKLELSNGWVQTYSVYSDSSTGDVWGNGYVEDPESIDATGSAGRWLSYTHSNGEFDILGSDEGRPVRASFGPDDVTWTFDQEGGWISDIAHPNSGPQPLWPIVLLVVAAAVVLSGTRGARVATTVGLRITQGRIIQIDCRLSSRIALAVEEC